MKKILYSILNDLEYTDPPHSIFEDLLLAIKTGNVPRTAYAYDNLTRDEKILFCKLNRREYFEPPHSRLERLLIKWLYLDLYLNIDGVPPFTFVSNGSPIVDYLISGNAVQSGTHTPDNPIMPQGTGERTTNLCPMNFSHKGVADDNGNTSTYNTRLWSDKIPVSASQSYYVAIDGVASNDEVLRFNRAIQYDTSGTFISRINAGANTTATFTTAANCAYIALDIRTMSLNVNLNDTDVNTIQMNTGSTPKPYEPYGYKIQISSANTTTPIYLGEVETTRKVKKVEYNGTESWNLSKQGNNTRAYTPQIPECMSLSPAICTHFNYNVANVGYPRVGEFVINSSKAIIFGIDGNTFEDVAAWKSYLAAQYAAGTPVTVWYVLATPETGIVNEPLMRIGNYADSISYEQTVVSIPTVSGRNTFDVLGDVKPSNV